MMQAIREMAREKAHEYSTGPLRRRAFVRGYVRAWHADSDWAEVERDKIPAAWAAGYLAGTTRRHEFVQGNIREAVRYWERREGSFNG